MSKNTKAIRIALILLLVFALARAGSWQDELEKSLINQEVMLKVDVYKIRFQDSGFGFSQGKDVTNFDKTGFFYKSGIMKDDNPNELANRINAKGVEVFKAGTIVKIHEVEKHDDRIKIKFSTTGDKGAVTFHFEEKDGEQGFQNLYRQVFVVDNRKDLIATHPEWSAEILEKIKKGEVDIGFDEIQVEATFGPPAQVKKSKTSAGTSTIWIYYQATKVVQITFVDGKVESVDEEDRQ
jgi:hypothetical protein